MNPNLAKLKPAPFSQLATLLADIPRRDDLIRLSLGEPKRKPPAFIASLMREENAGLNKYPTIRGDEKIRNACAAWLTKRFRLPSKRLDPALHILPVNGTREALFAIAQCLVKPGGDRLVMLPNPFYQIYEGAAIIAGAEPFYLNCLAENNFLPDIEEPKEKDWKRCELIYICSPHNPSGSVMPLEMYAKLLELARRYDFFVISDECYSEIYSDENSPPMSLLNASLKLGDENYSRCLSFYSLSKRSGLPGIRSGFVAGDPSLIAIFAKYRAYHGCAMPPLFQNLSAAAWADELYVKESRHAYQRKMLLFKNIVADKLELQLPQGGFYFWANVHSRDDNFARELFAKKGVEVLPGSYMARLNKGCNPGSGYARIAMVAEEEDCKKAAIRLLQFLAGE